MKILIPILGFTRSGGGRVLTKFANEWSSNGHVVHFLVNQNNPLPYFPTIAGIKWVTNSGEQANGPNRNLKTVRGWFNLFSLYLGLSKIGSQYDVVLANHSLTAFPVYFAKCGTAKKIYYVQAYEPEFYALQPGIKPSILKWLSGRSYCFSMIKITNCPLYLKYKNISAISWVPPGIDFQDFYKKIKHKDFAASSEIIIGCIGRREPNKGIDLVLKAFDLLSKVDHRFVLHVAYGNLPYSYSHPKLKICNPSNDRELGDFYRSLDILVAPGTIQLGSPHYPVMEAMACGVPLVTTGYLPANENNSWIVKVGCVDSIVEAVLKICNDFSYSDRVERASIDIMDYEWEVSANRFLALMSGN